VARRSSSRPIVRRAPSPSPLFFAVSAAEEPQPGARQLPPSGCFSTENRRPERAPRSSASAAARSCRSTTPDYTAYQIVTARGRWQAGLELIAKLFIEPPASDSALLRQRQAILGELATARGDGEALRALIASAYGGHPYRQPLLGTAETLSDLQAPPLRTLHRRGYRPFA